MQKIILLGYMGSGKTTVGQNLANHLDLDFIDLDAYIEASENLSVAALFEKKGEIYFRKVEHQLLSALISQPRSFVLSLGGGTPCYANNHLLLDSDDVHSVYLKASIATLAERLQADTTERPLLPKKPDDLHEFIAKHLFDRSYYYNQAKYIISVDSKTSDEVVSELVLRLT